MDINAPNAARPLLVVLLLISSASGASWHVANSAPGASDRNNGRSATMNRGNGPLKTLTKALNKARPGDTVWVYDGNYQNEESGWGVGVIPVPRSGTSTAWIRVKAAAGHSPRVSQLRCEGVSYIEIRGLTFRYRNWNLPAKWVDMPQVVVDDPLVSIDFDEDISDREPKYRRKFATFMSIFDHMLKNHDWGMDIIKCHHIEIAENDFSGYGFGILARNQCSYLQIHDNTFHHSMNGIYTWKSRPSLSHSTIRDNRFTQHFSTPIDLREGADDNLVEGNVFQYSGYNHINVMAGASNNIVRNNTGTHGGYYCETMRNPGGSAFNVHSAGPGNIVEGNLAAHHIDRSYHDGNGFAIDRCGGSKVIIRNNIAYRNMGSGVNITLSQGSEILNNTFVENGFMSTNSRVGGVKFSRQGDIDHTVVNNIFCENASGIWAHKQIAKQKRIDHNLYFSSTGKPLIWDSWGIGERQYVTLAAIQANSDSEQHGVAGDPKLANPAEGAFHLLPGSPAIDAGKDVGLRFQGQSPDIGAGEFDEGPAEPRP